MTDKTKKPLKEGDKRVGRVLTDEEKKKLAAARKRARESNSTYGLPDGAFEMLKWVYDWGFSFRKVLPLVVRHEDNRVLNKLINEKMIIPKKVSEQFSTVEYLVLSEGAIRYIEGKLDKKFHVIYKANKSRHAKTLLEHDYYAQKMTITIINNWINKGYKDIVYRGTSNLFALNNPESNQKLPDATVQYDASGSVYRIGIEVELTKKHGHEYDIFRQKIINQTSQGISQDPNKLWLVCHKWFILSDHDGVLDTYPKGFKPGVEIQQWNKHSMTKKFEKAHEDVGKKRISDFFQGKFEFIDIKDPKYDLKW